MNQITQREKIAKILVANGFIKLGNNIDEIKITKDGYHALSLLQNLMEARLN